MEKVFNAENIDFKARIKKKIPPIGLITVIIVAVALSIVEKRKFEFFDFIVPISILLLVFAIIIFENKSYIYQIRLDEDKIQIFGMKYSQKWKVILDIQKTKIKIIPSKAKSGHILGYIIELKVTEKCFVINKLHNWNNFVLYELFQTFKKIKCEKITSDEIKLLNKIEKRAQDKFE